MESFFVIILPLAIGYAFSKGKIFDDKAPIILNQFLIYIALPALVLLKIPTIKIDSNVLTPIVISWVVMLSSAVLIIILSKVMIFARDVTGSLLLVAVLGNTSFLGIPMITSYLGQASLPYIVIYDQIGTFLALATYGTLIVSLYTNANGFSIRDMVKKVITFPPFIAALPDPIALSRDQIKSIIVPQTRPQRSATLIA